MTEILKSYKFRIYPDSDQQTKLNQTFGCAICMGSLTVACITQYNEIE